MANTILNGWTINFVSAGLSGFSYNSAAAPKPIVNITADFGTAGPLDFVVSAASATDFLKVNYTYTIINDTGKNWVGFRIDYVDQIPPVPDFTEPAHPPYAHFHDNTAP